MTKTMFFKINFPIWRVCRKHREGLTPDLCWLFCMMRTVYHIIVCWGFFGKWHNYWEFSRLWPGEPNYFQEQYMYSILCWLTFFSRGDFIWPHSKTLQSLEIGLWCLYSPGTGQADGQRNMVARRVSRVTKVLSCILVIWSSKPMVPLSCLQLPCNLLACLVAISLA